MVKPSQAALIIIDMQMGFIDSESSLCIKGAAATVPACARALQAARDCGIRIFHVRREYAVDGSDVETTRYDVWNAGGKPLSQAWPESLAAPKELAEHEGEEIVMKPRFSAFFGTELAERLHEMGINTVILAGTTTPNCIRSTCYDALSYDFNVVVLEDATSSRTSEVQKANVEDMRVIGAQIMNVADFEERGCTAIDDVAAHVIGETGVRR